MDVATLTKLNRKNKFFIWIRMRIQFLCSFYFDQGLVIGLISQIQ